MPRGNGVDDLPKDPETVAQAIDDDHESFGWVGLHDPSDVEMARGAASCSTCTIWPSRTRCRCPPAAEGRALRRDVPRRTEDALVRRRGRRGRDGRDHHVRRAAVRRDGAARRGWRARHRAAASWRSVPRCSAHGPAAVLCGDLRRDRRPVRGGRPTGRDGRRRGRGLGVLTRADQRLGAHLHAQARGRGDARGRSTRCASRWTSSRTGSPCPGSTGRGAVLPRRRRPPQPRLRPDRRRSTPCCPPRSNAHLAQISVQQNDDMRKISAGVGHRGGPDADGRRSTA